MEETAEAAGLVGGRHRPRTEGQSPNALARRAAGRPRRKLPRRTAARRNATTIRCWASTTMRSRRESPKPCESLNYREREIIRLRYGLSDGYAYTLSEVGKIFSVTRERIRQIECEALRKLQQPSCAQQARQLPRPNYARCADGPAGTADGREVGLPGVREWCKLPIFTWPAERCEFPLRRPLLARRLVG